MERTHFLLQLNQTQRIEYRFKRKEFLDDFRVKMSGISPQELIQALREEFGQEYPIYNFAKLLELDSSSVPSMDLFLSLCAYAQLDPMSYFEMAIWKKV